MATGRKLIIPPGYDPRESPRVASFAAQLEDQLVLLKKNTADLGVLQLEWQPHLGTNTIGMLMAHLALVDIWWLRILPREVPIEEHEQITREIVGIGMDDDGMPVPAGGRHPASLAGKTAQDYRRMIDAAREATDKELRTWKDPDLASTYTFRDLVITREWTIYHILEHFSAHHGQILLLKHLMRDAGILAAAEKKK